MHILALNQDWFCDDWRALGHWVVTAGLSEHLDIRQTSAVLHLDRIVDMVDGFKPDRIVVFDNSGPVFISGLDETKIPTLFYSVDAHHHAEVHTYYTKLFDYVVCAQRDYIERMQKLGEQVEWLPLWASRDIEPSTEKEYGAVFVGNLDASLNPERVEFFRALEKEVPVLCKMGKFWEIFPKAEVVMNQTVKGDLNFRVFEAMMSGSVLLTEKAANGLFDLFEDGVHLVSYEKNNVEQAAELIKELLADKERCRRIGAAGRERVMKLHRAANRGNRILEILETLEHRDTGYRQFAACYNYEIVSRKVKNYDPAASVHALARALQCADLAMRWGEPMNAEIGLTVVAATLQYDRLIRGTKGADLLEELLAAYPASEIVSIGVLRNRLNQGRIAEAETLAARLQPDDPRKLFAQAEYCIQDLLQHLEN